MNTAQRQWTCFNFLLRSIQRYRPKEKQQGITSDEQTRSRLTMAHHELWQWPIIIDSDGDGHTIITTAAVDQAPPLE
jgi:hypothetical protein